MITNILFKKRSTAYYLNIYILSKYKPIKNLSPFDCLKVYLSFKVTKLKTKVSYGIFFPVSAENWKSTD